MSRQLTDQQKKIVFEKNGHFVVRACPGSGKTFTVAARLSRLLSEWDKPHQGIAAISFTNVAWEEIEGYLAKDFGVSTPIGYPHFLGTIDSFIDKFIFLPFGHTVMGCYGRPELTGPPHDNFEPIGSFMWWPKNNSQCYKGCKLNDFFYEDDGCLANNNRRSQFKKCESNHSACTRLKKEFNESGRATQLDANYFAMRILIEYPVIAKALASRFPNVMIDEAQDTSSTQMKILDSLVENGLSQLMLVGDPDQAIYEWRSADPTLFDEKYSFWKDNSEKLMDNWRSTQRICDFVSRISSSDEPMVAKNEELASFGREPEIWGYSCDDELPDIVSRFCTECQKNDIKESAISVLTRSNDFLNDVIPGVVRRTPLNPWKDGDKLTKGFANSKYLFDQGNFPDAFRLLERTMCIFLNRNKAYSREELNTTIAQFGFAEWRTQLYHVLSSLPNTDCNLCQWISQANSLIRDVELLSGCDLCVKRDLGGYKYSELSFDDLFAIPNDPRRGIEYSFGTVHSVKGKTRDAVLLVLKERAGTSKLYKNLLEEDIALNEELRILYVAITRPRKVLILAVPEKDLKSWRGKFFG
jgi:DNA helicase-2/ATP-dependent DNA helicase PcrA